VAGLDLNQGILFGSSIEKHFLSLHQRMMRVRL